MSECHLQKCPQCHSFCMDCTAGARPAPTLRMMQMVLLTALMIDDNILLLMKDVFTFSA